MIEERLRECTDVAGVGRLFSDLGYPVEVQELAGDHLTPLGIQLDRLPKVHHITRYGGVDVYVVESVTDEQLRAVDAFEESLIRRNAVTKPVIVDLGTKGRVAMITRARDRRRRLEIDCDRPGADSIDRIASLRIDGTSDESADPRELFERVMDREAIGKRFFLGFRKATDRLAEAIRSEVPRESRADCADFALLLLSRILFLYFLQRKGWLDEDHRFLRRHLDWFAGCGRTFHRAVLRCLFFDCLNTPVKNRAARARKLGRIPYLNGGLFDPSEFELRNDNLDLPDELWRSIFEETFERFSFSISEDTEGMHIDPEMLGKVFENLMEDDERARTGTFYTPKMVVDRLSTSAVVSWCADGESGLRSSLASVLEGDACGIDHGVAERVLDRIESITVLDSACGSGAFLLSAMRVIEQLVIRLSDLTGREVPPNLRQMIAGNSLFGVDLKMEAVRLCELRIWLAIVSESHHGIDSVPPLPNLDRNVFQGNTLVSPLDFLAEGRGEIYREWAFALRARADLIVAYQRAPSSARTKLAGALRDSDRELASALLSKSIERDEGELARLASTKGLFDGAPEKFRKERQNLSSRIESSTKALKRLARGEVDFFSFELHFAHVLASGGFSVVIGNPPWVRASRIDGQERKLLADRYRCFSDGGSRGFRQAEMALAFVERSLELAADDGVIAKLIPSKVLTADYGRTFRTDLTTRGTLLEVVDWSREGRALFSADVFPLGVVAGASRRPASTLVERRNQCTTLASADISVAGPGSPWTLAPPPVRRILSRLRERFPTFAESLGRTPIMGVKTGANKTFFVDRVVIEGADVFLPDIGERVPTRAIVRTVRGRDLRPWQAQASTWMLWPPGLAGDVDLGVRVASRLGLSPRAFRLAYVRSEHLGLKVGWKDLSRGLQAAVLPDEIVIDAATFSLVPNQTVYSVDTTSMDESLAVCGLLNSTILDALALETAEPAKDDHRRYLATTMSNLPFPRLSTADSLVRDLVALGRRAQLGLCDVVAIDDISASLFGVSSSEMKLLRAFVDDELGSARV